MSSGRDYDLIVFGFSGYTGKFVAEEVYRLQTEGKRSLTWAVAGRNMDKLKQSMRDSGIENVDVVVADVSDEASLEAMCARTTVLLNCVGPFQLYGEAVVKACINKKCNYVDITGETYFMEKMEAEYGEKAKEAGVYIVNACAFDCIPNDIGALVLQKAFPGELVYTDSYLSTKNTGGFHTGTWESFLYSIRNVKQLSKLRREQHKSPLPLPERKPSKRFFLNYSDVVHKWCLLFPLPDRSVVYRSQRYRYENENVPPYHFRTFFCLASLIQAIFITFFFALLMLLVATNFGLKLMIKFPRLFSGGMASEKGATRKQLEKASFTVTLQGVGYDEHADRNKPPNLKLLVKVRGAEPGYIATSAMVVQSALTLLDERDAMPKNGGVYTPAAAFANTNIVNNLEGTGKIRFEVVPL